MAHNRYQQHIDSESFKRFAYYRLVMATPEQKQHLTIDEAKHFRSEGALRKFCNEERFDYIAMILAKIGIEWTMRFHEDANDADLLEFNTVEQNRYPQKRVDLAEAASRRNVVIISSRDVMALSHMVAQNCNTKVYELAEHTKKLQSAEKKIRKASLWSLETRDANEAHLIFNDLLLEQLNSFVYAKDILGIDEDDIRILCALYKKRNEAIKLTEIATLTKAVGRKMYYRKNMQRLLDEGLVTSDARDIKKVWANATYFFITTKGILKIMEYQKFIHNNVFK